MKLLSPKHGLSVRLWRESDAEAAFAVIEANRAHLSRWIPWTRSIRSPESLQEIIQHHAAERRAGRSWQYAILQDSRLVGGVGMVRRSPFHLELGVWVAEELEGQGVAAWACRDMLRTAFDHLRAEWVEICCAPGNRRSQAMAQRLGFVWEERITPTRPLSADAEETWVYRCYGPRLRKLLDETSKLRTTLRELALLPSFFPHPSGQGRQDSVRSA